MPLDAPLLRRLLAAPEGPLARLEVVPEVESTNTVVAEDLRADPLSWPEPSMLVADWQTAGRGRAGRSWDAPPGTAITATIAHRPDAPVEDYGWIPLLTGLAVVKALAAEAGIVARLKWPNDVVIDSGGETVDGWGTWRKLGGILTEVLTLPDGLAVIIGIGVNVSQTAEQLPVPWATSLALAGVGGVSRETLLVAVLRALSVDMDRYHSAGRDLHAAGLTTEVAGVCLTLGRDVHVRLPGGRVLDGRAERLDESGALVVRPTDGEPETVLAGDVLLVRPRM